MNYRAICLTISLLTAALPAAAIELCGELRQGEIIVGRVEDEADAVVFNGRTYPVTEDGYFIFALPRDQKEDAVLTAEYPHKDKKRFAFRVASYPWDIQRINGIPQSKVTPDSSHEAEILREQKDVRRSLTVMQPGDDWREGFVLPVEGRISGEFGNQRIFNGTPKSPHSGTDIAAPAGTPVKAAGSGTVILNGKNYFYTGNMVIIDHGQGLQTIYAHLSRSAVKQGQKIKQGDIVGYVGATGRATGPHLHWGASLHNVRFRPHALLDINDKKCRQIAAGATTAE